MSLNLPPETLEHLKAEGVWSVENNGRGGWTLGVEWFKFIRFDMPDPPMWFDGSKAHWWWACVKAALAEYQSLEGTFDSLDTNVKVDIRARLPKPPPPPPEPQTEAYWDGSGLEILKKDGMDPAGSVPEGAREITQDQTPEKVDSQALELERDKRLLELKLAQHQDALAQERQRKGILENTVRDAETERRVALERERTAKEMVNKIKYELELAQKEKQEAIEKAVKEAEDRVRQSLLQKGTRRNKERLIDFGS